MWLTLDAGGTTLAGGTADWPDPVIYRRALGEERPFEPDNRSQGFPLSLGPEAGAAPELGRMQDGSTGRQRGSSGVARFRNRQGGF